MQLNTASRLQCLLIMLSSLLVGGCAGGQSQVKRVAFMGWPEAYALSNGQIEVVVVPEVGRIMSIAPVGGENVLWVNETVAGKPPEPTGWTNYGGDKVWPWPQEGWRELPGFNGANWPPPPAADREPHEVEIDGDTLRLISRPLDHFNLRIVRELRLEPDQPAMVSRVWFERTEGAADGETSLKPWCVWIIAQVPSPGAIIDLAAVSPATQPTTQPLGRMPQHVQEGGSQIWMLRTDRGGDKIGADGRRVTTMVGDTVLSMHIESWEPASAKPEPGEMIQVYGSGDREKPRPYTELEVASPAAIAPSLTVRYTVVRLP